MAVETTTVEINSGSYTKVSATATGWAWVGNPFDSGDDVLFHIGTTAPVPATKARFRLKPDETIQRTTDIDNFIWAKCATIDSIDFVLSE